MGETIVEPIVSPAIGELFGTGEAVGLSFSSDVLLGVGVCTGVDIGVGVAVGVRLGLGVFEDLEITANTVGVWRTLVCPLTTILTTSPTATSNNSPTPPAASHTHPGNLLLEVGALPSEADCTHGDDSAETVDTCTVSFPNF